MQWLKIAHIPETLKGTVKLPASKSISNRALILQALAGNRFNIHNLSTADDTRLMQAALAPTEKELYIKNAGTAMRFLTAYYAVSEHEVVLRGSERMNERPIAPLVNVLRVLGAEIDYLEKEGFPPVYIKGKPLVGGRVSLSPSQSSQFISALLLIAPVLKEGVIVELDGPVVSAPYIDMTLHLLTYFGVNWEKDATTIRVNQQSIIPKDIFIESDWSSASYWYGLAALFPGSEIELPEFHNSSWQGDKIISSLMERYGIGSVIADRILKLRSSNTRREYFECHLIDHPDLIPTMAAFCSAAGIPFSISGIETLKYKESDRAAALVAELSKLYSITRDEKRIYADSKRTNTSDKVYLKTYDDHRLAMSFLMPAVMNENVYIENPFVTDKSYPGFWDDLVGLGFRFEIFER